MPTTPVLGWPRQEDYSLEANLNYMKGRERGRQRGREEGRKGKQSRKEKEENKETFINLILFTYFS